jgi:hypothetical protein
MRVLNQYNWVKNKETQIMKKILMFGAAALCAAASFRDVSSQNIVG